VAVEMGDLPPHGVAQAAAVAVEMGDLPPHGVAQAAAVAVEMTLEKRERRNYEPADWGSEE
jgi:hypothetical protein